MTTTTSHPGKHLAQAAERKAQRAAAAPWVEAFVRFGFVARGLVYFIIGGLALQLALGHGGAATTPQGALDYIGGFPFGPWLLGAVAVGLVGYSLWGLIRAFLDPLRKGFSPKGLVTRAGYLVSAASYGILAVPVILSLLNPARGTSGNSSNNLIPELWAKPYGFYLVVGVAVFWLLSGLGQLAIAYKAGFTQELDTSRMSASETKFAEWVGQVGYGARGVVFLIISFVIFRAIQTANANGAGGLYDAALEQIGRVPYGHVLLGAVAAGLMLFGLFSVLAARWHMQRLPPVR